MASKRTTDFAAPKSGPAGGTPSAFPNPKAATPHQDGVKPGAKFLMHMLTPAANGQHVTRKHKL